MWNAVAAPGVAILALAILPVDTRAVRSTCWMIFTGLHAVWLPVSQPVPAGHRRAAPFVSRPSRLPRYSSSPFADTLLLVLLPETRDAPTRGTSPPLARDPPLPRRRGRDIFGGHPVWARDISVDVVVPPLLVHVHYGVMVADRRRHDASQPRPIPSLHQLLGGKNTKEADPSRRSPPWWAAARRRTRSPRGGSIPRPSAHRSCTSDLIPAAPTRACMRRRRRRSSGAWRDSSATAGGIGSRQVRAARLVGRRGAARRRRRAARVAGQSVHQAGPDRRGEAADIASLASSSRATLARRARRPDVCVATVVRRRCPRRARDSPSQSGDLRVTGASSSSLYFFGWAARPSGSACSNSEAST